MLESKQVNPQNSHWDIQFGVVGIAADPQKITIDRLGQFPHMIAVRHQLSYEEMSRPINRTKSL